MMYISMVQKETFEAYWELFEGPNQVVIWLWEV